MLHWNRTTHNCGLRICQSPKNWAYLKVFSQCRILLESAPCVNYWNSNLQVAELLLLLLCCVAENWVAAPNSVKQSQQSRHCQNHSAPHPLIDCCCQLHLAEHISCNCSGASGTCSSPEKHQNIVFQTLYHLYCKAMFFSFTLLSSYSSVTIQTLHSKTGMK